MTRDCTHGQLARSCNICELEQEVAMLRQKYAAVAQIIASVILAPKWSDAA